MFDYVVVYNDKRLLPCDTFEDGDKWARKILETRRDLFYLILEKVDRYTGKAITVRKYVLEKLLDF